MNGKLPILTLPHGRKAGVKQLAQPRYPWVRPITVDSIKALAAVETTKDGHKVFVAKAGDVVRLAFRNPTAGVCDPYPQVHPHHAADLIRFIRQRFSQVKVIYREFVDENPAMIPNLAQTTGTRVFVLV